MTPSREFIVHSLFLPDEELRDSIIETPFDEDVCNSIRQQTAHAATDASVKFESMGRCQIMTNMEKTCKREKILCHEEQGDNSSGVAEVLVLLKLLEAIEVKGRQIEEGELCVGFDHRKACEKIVSQIRRTNDYAQESGSEISRIKELLEKIKFDIKLRLVRGHDDPTKQFNSQPLKHLIRECDLKARKTRTDVDNFDQTTNIKFYGNYATMHNDVIMSRNIQDAVRIIDSKKAEQQHRKRKLGHNYEFVDQDA